MSNSVLALAAPESLPDFAESVRLAASQALADDRRVALGQYFTPRAVSELMASLSRVGTGTVRLLDAGAGVGMLSAAWVHRACNVDVPPSRIEITAFELDEELVPSLRSVLDRCCEFGGAHGVDVAFEIRQEDFIRSAVHSLNGGLFGTPWPAFDAAILNPPYRKFRTDSPERALLREVGLETSNSYAAFVAVALRALHSGGELIAITPRSFCNGPYFTPFRRDLMRLGSLSHLHVFDSRSAAFGSDDVLQENVVFRVDRGRPQAETVQVEWSASGDAAHTARREVPFAQVVRPGDPDFFIHIAADEWDSRVADIVRGLRGDLSSLGLQVSTGRVVDFRAKEFLRSEHGPNTVPLIYPTHFDAQRVSWPKAESRKPNALVRAPETESQLNPNGTYVLVKRFTSKEERRRIVAAVFEPHMVASEFVAFENHLNYFHRGGVGLPRNIAVGLATYLNSTLIDQYFRQFNGHTQVNATDLRKLPYPTVEQLDRIADAIGQVSEQAELDDIVEGELLDVADKPRSNTAGQRRISKAVTILKALGLPKEQINERAALTLLVV